MHLTITRVDEVLYRGAVFSVNVPGAAGEVTILAHHAPLITPLKAGEIRIHEGKDGAHAKKFAIEGGVLEVTPSGVTILL